MLSYPMPPDINEKEKAIGGVLTFVQFFWLLGWGILAIGVFMVLRLITKITIIAIIPALPIAGMGLVFAFKKVHNLTYFAYLKYNHIFKQKNKKLYNRRYFN